MTQLNLLHVEEIRPRCPECGVGTIELVTDGEVGEAHYHGVGNFSLSHLAREWVMRPAAFGACNRCEFCIEIDPRELRGSISDRRRSA